jgi:hypothetical protein
MSGPFISSGYRIKALSITASNPVAVIRLSAAPGTRPPARGPRPSAKIVVGADSVQQKTGSWNHGSGGGRKFRRLALAWSRQIPKFSPFGKSRDFDKPAKSSRGDLDASRVNSSLWGRGSFDNDKASFQCFPADSERLGVFWRVIPLPGPFHRWKFNNHDAS